MENSCLVQGAIINDSTKAMIVKSPDFPKINGIKLRAYDSIPLTLRFSSELKIKQDIWTDAEDNYIVYITLVDKDF